MTEQAEQKEAGSAPPETSFETQTDDAIIDAALSAVGDESGGGADGATGPPQPDVVAEPVVADAKEADPQPPNEKVVEGEGEDKTKGEGDKEAPAEPQDRAWAAIRRKEKELGQARTELQGERSRIDLERDQYSKLGDSVRQMQADLRMDPLGFMKRNGGYEMDDLVEIALGTKKADSTPAPQQQQAQDQKPDPVMKELAEIRAMITEGENQKILNQYRGSVDEALSGEKYNLLQSFSVMSPDGGFLSAAEVIEQRAAQAAASGVGADDLTPEKFADRLLSEYKELLANQASHSAVRQVLLSQDGKQAPSPKANGGKRTPQPKNVTNTLAAPQRPRAETQIPWDDDQAIIDDAVKLIPD